jgi:hypothetical protein
MLVHSAAQAISPAIERTRRLLFSPFQWGTFLKLCAIAVFTEGFGGNYNFSNLGHSSSHPAASSPSLPNTAFAWTPGWIALIAAIVLAGLLLGFLILYLITRLRFALFHCLVFQTREILPGWRLYREQANRFFFLNLIAGLVFLFLIVLAAAPFALGIFRIVSSAHRGGHLNIASLLSLALPLLAVLLLVALAAIALDIVLRDFMLPHYALEDASAGEAWAQVRTYFAAEKGAFVLYGVLRILLPISAMFALIMALAIPMLIVLGIFVVLFAAVHGVSDMNGTLGGIMLGSVLKVVLGAAALALTLLLAICLGGPLCLWVRNFALTFYGGRYGMLGDALFPPPPPPLFAPDGSPTL